MAEQKRVFVVEDDKFLSSLLKARLEKEGFNVAQAFDGQEAVDWLKKGNRPNLVLLDLIMPRMSGFGVLQAIATDPQISDIPVVILTNLAQDSDVEKARQLHAKEYFVKVRSSIDEIVSHVALLLK